MIAHFDIAPRDASYPASAERFEYRFLGGPATGVMLRRCFPLTAIFDLVLRVNSLNKQLTVPFDHAGDAQAFDDVGPHSDDVHVATLTS